MNQILVFRQSNTNGVNNKLRDALMNHYDRSCTPMFPLPMGGLLSCLITDKTFEQIVQVVKDADCGESILVIDGKSTSIKSETIIATQGIKITNLSQTEITEHIDRLMIKQRSPEGLNTEETTLLTELLNT